MMAIYVYLLRALQGSYPEKYHKGLIINGSYMLITAPQCTNHTGLLLN